MKDNQEIEVAIAQIRVNMRYCDDSERRELEERVEELQRELASIRKYSAYVERCRNAVNEGAWVSEFNFEEWKANGRPTGENF